MRDAINQLLSGADGGGGASRLEMLEKMASGLYNIVKLLLPLPCILLYSPKPCEKWGLMLSTFYRWKI